MVTESQRISLESQKRFIQAQLKEDIAERDRLSKSGKDKDRESFLDKRIRDFKTAQIPMINRQLGGLSPRGRGSKVKFVRRVRQVRVAAPPSTPTKPQISGDLRPPPAFVVSGRPRQPIRGEQRIVESLAQTTVTVKEERPTFRQAPPVREVRRIPITKERITPEKPTGISGAVFGPRKPFKDKGITTHEEFLRLKERKDAPIRSKIFQPVEGGISFLEKQTKKVGVLKPAALFPVGVLSGGVELVKTIAHPIKSTKQIIAGIKDPLGSGRAFGERIEKKGLTFVGGELAGFSKGGGALQRAALKPVKLGAKAAKTQFIKRFPPKITTPISSTTLTKSKIPQATMVKSKTVSGFEMKPTKFKTTDATLGTSKPSKFTFAGKPPQSKVVKPRRPFMGKKAQLQLTRPKLKRPDTPSQILKAPSKTPVKLPKRSIKFMQFGGPEVGAGVAFILKQRPVQRAKSITRQETILKRELITERVAKQIPEDIIISDTKPIETTMPKQSIKTIPALVSIPISTQLRKRDLLDPMPTPTIPKISIPKAPFIPRGSIRGFGFGRGGGLLKRRTEFKPTARAVALDIRGGKTTGVFTGIEERGLPGKKRKKNGRTGFTKFI